MYLKEIHISKFRGINELTINFQKGLNVLIGENNSCKTAIIDAIRIALSWGDLKRDAYFSKEYDFFVDKTNPGAIHKESQIDLVFCAESDDEAAVYRDLMKIGDDDTVTLELHIKYYLEPNGRFRYKIWGGENEGHTVPNETLQLISSTHLDALRDAEKFLRPFKDSKLTNLYTDIKTHTSEEKEALAKKVTDVLDTDEWKEFIDSGKEKVNEHLLKTTFSDQQQEINVSFTGLTFQEILNNLQLKIPVFTTDVLEANPGSKQSYFNIWQNGLGYNNLIYIATVLGDIKQQRETDPDSYRCLLIEEPEAHLHPQLQSLFFDYLDELSQQKEFQIFISSHSPTITAKASLDSIIVQGVDNDNNKSLSLFQSSLSTDNKKYLSKFLDVTKAQLFFGSGALLVEGISEALLIPTFSTMIEGEYSTTANGIEVVNVGGVSFEHFAVLYNSDEEDSRMINRCAVITDDDREELAGTLSARASKAKALEKNNLAVFLAKKTFEFELVIASEFNRDLALEIYREMHPLTEIEPGTNLEEQAWNFVETIDRQKSKSDFAHRLAIRLDEDAAAKAAFVVPDYISAAIKYVTDSE